MFGASSTRAIAIASIGSGTVSIGIAKVSGNSTSLTINASRVLPAETREVGQSAAALEEALMQAGQEAVARSNAKSMPRISEVYCVIRAPWTHAQTVQVGSSFTQEEHVTESLIARLARQALTQAADRERFLEATVARVMLNDYPTAYPEGKRARRIQLTALISSCDPAMRHIVQRSLEKLFPSRPILLRSGTRAFLETLSSARPNLHDCIVLDVGQDGTTALVVRDKAPEQESYLAEGITNMLQRVAPSMRPEETLAALRMMARDECSAETCLRVQEGFAKVEPELANSFGEFFTKLIALRRLPRALILVTDPNIAPWLSRFFARIDFTQFTEMAQPFSPDILSPEDLIVHIDKNAPAVPDIDLSVALALINKEMSEA